MTSFIQSKLVRRVVRSISTGIIPNGQDRAPSQLTHMGYTKFVRFSAVNRRIPRLSKDVPIISNTRSIGIILVDCLFKPLDEYFNHS